MLTVSRLSTTPVRGMQLHHPDEVLLGRHGVMHDRRYVLVTPDGRVFDGTKFGPLVQISAELTDDPERLTLRFPSGEIVQGHVALGEQIEMEAYGRHFRARAVVGPWAEAISDYAGRPIQLVRSERLASELDRHPVSLVSDASMAELSRRSNDGVALDPRRFRMTIQIANARPHEEDEWLGSLIRVGEATLRATIPDARCVVVTQDPRNGHRDFPALRAIKAYRGLRDGKNIDFGIYADVIVPGVVRLGDVITT